MYSSKIAEKCTAQLVYTVILSVAESAYHLECTHSHPHTISMVSPPPSPPSVSTILRCNVTSWHSVHYVPRCLQQDITSAINLLLFWISTVVYPWFRLLIMFELSNSVNSSNRTNIICSAG